MLASFWPLAMVLWADSEAEPAVFEMVSEAELAAFLRYRSAKGKELGVKVGEAYFAASIVMSTGSFCGSESCNCVLLDCLLYAELELLNGGEIEKAERTWWGFVYRRGSKNVTRPYVTRLRHVTSLSP